MLIYIDHAICMYTLCVCMLICDPCMHAWLDGACVPVGTYVGMYECVCLAGR